MKKIWMLSAALMIAMFAYGNPFEFTNGKAARAMEMDEIIPVEDFYYVGAWYGAHVNVAFIYYSDSSAALSGLSKPVITELTGSHQPNILSVGEPEYSFTDKEGSRYRHHYNWELTVEANYSDLPRTGDYLADFGQRGSFIFQLIQDAWEH